MAHRDLELLSYLLRIQRKENFPFPNPANVPELSVIDQAQVTPPTCELIIVATGIEN